MIQKKLTKSQNTLLSLILSKQANELNEIISMFMEELGIEESPTTFQDLVKNRYFEIQEEEK